MKVNGSNINEIANTLEEPFLNLVKDYKHIYKIHIKKKTRYILNTNLHCNRLKIDKKGKLITNGFQIFVKDSLILK